MNEQRPNTANDLGAPRIIASEVCPKLRTKTMYLNEDYRRHPDVPATFGTAAFWCLKTMSALGPDDLPADPESCRRNRGCCTLPPLV